MRVKFTSTNETKQNIKLIVNIDANQKIKSIMLKDFKSFSFNNQILFFYNLSVSSSHLLLDIYINNSIKLYENKLFLGSFIHDYSTSHSVSSIEINFNDNFLKDITILEFKQKDFIFNKYLKNSKTHKFETKDKLSFKNLNILSSINFLKILVSEPSNILYPEHFVKLIQKALNKKNIRLKILNKKSIKSKGLNCLLAVNQGSSKEPRVVEFIPKKNTNKNVDVLFVGKGVCFDSGGISIKPSAGMEDMKWDMAGAAVVSAIMKYLSNIKTSFSYAGIIGLVENMPSGSAYKPGDIIKSYKGINVEVLNTDAEGRLVLADIISYASDIYKPKLIIDFATLTGAIMVALGQHYAGLYANDDLLANQLYESGIRTNEKVWRMPLHEDFNKELNSSFVDLKNISSGRYGGSVTAAQFLQRFVPKNTKWAHLDIAGVTWKQNGDIMNSKGATGFGLTLISDFIDNYFKN